jgi:hypothetical protein
MGGDDMGADRARATAAAPGERTRLALSFCELGERLSKLPGKTELTDADCAPLADLVATDQFRRVGIWREEQSWPEYLAYMKAWAGKTALRTELRRVNEAGAHVFVEMAEYIVRGDVESSKNSMMVFTFDDGNRICGLNVYEQNENNRPKA